MECNLAGICGGCTYAEMTYEEQRLFKENQLYDLLKPVMDENSLWEGVLPSPDETAYRNKMEYSFGDEVKDGPLTLGMHKKKSFYSVVTCGSCRIVHEDFNRIVRATVDFFQQQGIPYMHKKTHEGYLRHLLLRRSRATGEILVGLVTRSGEIKAVELWKDLLLQTELEGTIAGILHIYNDSPADAVKNEGTEILYGKDSIEEKLLGLSFRITPFSFFQTNSAGAEVLYGKIREYVGDTSGQTVYDLYSGTGTIAQLAAGAASKVYGVEIVKEAVEAAAENAAINGLSNCEFIAGDVLDVIDGLSEKPDMIILDPPRDGLHPKVLPRIADYGVEKIAYIACKPSSFVRDMPTFAMSGYRIERCCGVDMFPFTRNVELVTLLSRRA